MNSPKVSVLLPNYNCARYLPEAIESVLGQEFRDFELLIVDNCSTDGSIAVIERYAALDSRIRFQVNPLNVGAPENFNRCLAWAQGEYVKFVCSDDLLASHQALSKLVAMLDANPTAALAASARNVVDENSKVVDVWNNLVRPGFRNGHAVVMRCLEKGHNLIGEPSAVLFRRAYAGRGFDPRYRQLVDLEMWVHLLGHGGLVYTPEALCSFRRHPLQLSALNWKRQVGLNEMDMLVTDYLHHPWLQHRLSRQSLFLMIYSHRKRRRGEKGVQEIEHLMIGRLGRGWYAALWLAYKLTKPLTSIKKMVAHSTTA